MTAQSVEIHERLASQNSGAFGEQLGKAYEAHQTLRERLSGTVPETDTTWTLEEHYVALLNQDEVWQDAQDRRHRLDDMDPRYSGNVLRFLLQQADDLFEGLLHGLGVSPESLGRWAGETAETWPGTCSASRPTA